MGMSVTTWRLYEAEFSRGIAYLESRFNAAHDEDDWGEGTDLNKFCEIGEVWDLVNLAISGQRIPAHGVESLVVLGGDTLREIGKSGGQITVKSQQEVAEVSQLLNGLNIALLVTTCEQLSNLPDFVISEVRQRLEDLQSHYASAAQEGQLVVTRVYGP